MFQTALSSGNTQACFKSARSGCGILAAQIELCSVMHLAGPGVRDEDISTIDLSLRRTGRSWGMETSCSDHQGWYELPITTIIYNAKLDLLLVWSLFSVRLRKGRKRVHVQRPRKQPGADKWLSVPQFRHGSCNTNSSTLCPPVCPSDAQMGTR